MTGVNRQPVGLLDLLQVQSGGLNPDNLAQTIRPTINIEPLYWPDRMRGFVEPFALTVGQADFVEVPAGQVWKLLTVGHSLDANVSTVESYSLTYGIERLPEQGLNGVEFAGYTSIPTTSASRQHDYVQLPHPFIITAGQRITVTCVNENVPGSLTGTFEGIFVLLQDLDQ